MTGAAVPLALTMVSLIGGAAYAQPNRETNAPGATQAQFERWMTELSTWQRWGPDDQLGSANLITPAKRLQAASLVETGETISLGHDLADGLGSDGNRPFALDMIISFDPDRIRDRRRSPDLNQIRRARRRALLLPRSADLAEIAPAASARARGGDQHAGLYGPVDDFEHLNALTSLSLA